MSTPKSERTLRARLAAQTRWANEDPVAGTAAARQAFKDSFATAVDPDGVLSEDERQRRAASARKAHFTRLALASAKARRAARQTGEGAA